MFAKKISLLVLSLALVVCFSLKVEAETLFYVPFDKSLNAEVSAGKASPLGADTAVISVFSEITKDGRGIKKAGDKNGEALDLTGESSRRSVFYESASNVNLEQGTIQFWVKPLFEPLPQLGKDDSRNFLYLKTQGGTYNGITVGYRDWYYEGKEAGPTLFFYINDGKHHGVQQDLRRIPAWKKNEWQHVLVCWDKNSMRLYLNGILIGKNEFKNNDLLKTCPPAGPMEIGKTESDKFPFLIDEIRIDDKPLLGEEISVFDPLKFPGIEIKQADISYFPVMPCAKIGEKPVIDGKFDDNVWKDAKWISGFTALTREFTFVGVQTLAASCYDNDNLYLAFVCPEPYMEQVASVKREKDGAVWRDESVEFFACPKPDDASLYYQFIVNAAGSCYDGKGKSDSAWNGEWNAAVFKDKDKWTVEIVIPWKTLNIQAPEPGGCLAFNAARDRYVPGGEFSSLSFVAYPDFALTKRFGRISFVREPGEIGDEEKLNSIFMEVVNTKCRETAEIIGAQIKNCEYLWGKNPETDKFKEDLESWDKLNARNLNECVRKHMEIPLVLANSASTLNNLREKGLSEKALNPGKEEYVLGNKTRFVISRKNGTLVGVVDSGNLLSSSIIDRFCFETRKGDKNTVDESFDVIIPDSLKTDGNSFAAAFVNPALKDIKVKKAYRLADDSSLVKRVEFIREGEGEYKISGITETVLRDDFLRGGVFSTYPSAIGSVRETFLVSADDIQKGQSVQVRQWIESFGKGLVNFTNKERNKGFGQFQKSINDGFAYPPAGFEMTYFTFSGWQLSWFCGSLGKDIKSTAAETCYHVFDGDRTKFHLAYQNIIKLKDAWQGWSPIKWSDKIRWIDSIAWACELKSWEKGWDVKEKYLRDWCDKNGRQGDVAVVLSWITHRFGAPPISDDSLISYYASLSEDSTHKAGLYAPRFQNMRNDPRMVTGTYYWPWGIHKDVTDIAEKHPEWMMHEKNGNLMISVVSQIGGATIEYVPRFTPAYDKWWVKNCMAMLDYLKLRMFYTDGSAMSVPILDWNTMKIRTQADGLNLAKLIWEGCRKRNVIWFANDGYIMTPFKDISWAESVETLMNWDDWRQTAEAFLTMRLYANPNVPQYMIYWREPNNIPCINTVILLGARASTAHFECPKAVQEPYIQIGQEMFLYMPVFPDLRPCYWLEDTDIEAYALKRKDDGGILLTFQNHKKENSEVAISFNAEKAGLDLKRPVYGWHLDTRTFDELKSNPTNDLFEVKDIRRNLTLDGKNLKIKINNVKPGVAKQVYLSNIPAFVWKIDGKPTELKACSVLNTQIKDIGKDKLEIATELDAVILCPMINIAKVQIDKNDVETQKIMIGNTECISFKVPAGKHQVRLLQSIQGNDALAAPAKKDAVESRSGSAFFDKKGNALTVKAGGYEIHFAEGTSWTFREALYHGKQILASSGWQQAVLSEVGLPKGVDSFLGSGHRKEKVLSVNLSAYQNDKLIGTYPVAEGLSVTNGTFFIMEKKSRFISEYNGLFYDHTSRISIGADGISEDFYFKVTGEKASCVEWMYIFMHIFPKTIKTWIAGDEHNEIERGTFVADASFTLKKDFLWLIVYGPADGLGVVYKYPEVYEGMEGFKNSFWNRADDNKLYLRINPKRNKGEEFSFLVKLKAFEAKEDNWEAEAKKALSAINFNK